MPQERSTARNEAIVLDIMSPAKHVAFSVAGGCYPYQMGVAYFIQQHFDVSDVQFSGASGGSWPAFLLASGVDIRHVIEVLLRYGVECARGRRLGAYGVYSNGMRDVYNRCFGHLNAPQLVRGRLAISVSRVVFGAVPHLRDEVITEFYSNEDIINCIIASSLIPYAVTGEPFMRFRDWICVDAGLTNVAGVKRFAEAVVHDLEMFEDDVLYRASHLSQRINTQFSEQLKHMQEEAPVMLEQFSGRMRRQLSMMEGPYGVLRLAQKISSVLADKARHALEIHIAKCLGKHRHPPADARPPSPSSGGLLGYLSGSLGYLSEKLLGISRKDNTDDIREHLERKGRWADCLVDIAPDIENNKTSVLSDDEDSAVDEGVALCTKVPPSRTLRHDGIITDGSHGTYWRKKSELIKKTPDGGTLLELAPWTWRQQPLINYHLTSDAFKVRQLFDMGIADAAEHYWDLLQFFRPEEYQRMLAEHD